MNLKKMSIQGGHLIAEMDDMSKVDLGQVVGAKGDKGDKGDTGATGKGITSITETPSSADGGTNNITVTYTDSSTDALTVKNGSKGNDGITPTFSIENGHLFADYDNPYTGA